MFTNGILLVLAINAIVVIALIGTQLRLRGYIKRLEKTIHKLSDDPQDMPPELAKHKNEAPRLVITLDILNSSELVAKRSWFGGKLGAVTPSLMHRIVLNQTRDQLRAGMRESGVEADIRVVRRNEFTG